MSASEYTLEQLLRLDAANRRLRLDDSDENSARTQNIVFVYAAPKVGGTTLVSSLRLWAAARLTVLHIHDEAMLEAMGLGLGSVSVMDVVRYNRYLGRNVWVVDVFRPPAERKMSEFFERLGDHHFNVGDEMLAGYKFEKLERRFNRLWPWLATADPFLERYGCGGIPAVFPHEDRRLVIESDGITFVKLRLCDADAWWGGILTALFGTEIRVVRDYEGAKKSVVGGLYEQFKAQYRLPDNYAAMLREDMGLCYYYSAAERETYLANLSTKTKEAQPYTAAEYAFYEELSLENAANWRIQFDHYLDCGCICRGCSAARARIVAKVRVASPLNSDDVVRHGVVPKIAASVAGGSTTYRAPSIASLIGAARP